MNNVAAKAVRSVADIEVIKKVSRRLLPFLFILYVINYLDRINVGFAALSMNKAIGLTATTFGLANTVFYLGYIACEIPSNLLLARFGARIWIPRILISWGIASAATMLVVGANSLYFVRILVGIAEAGFVPGVLLYLTYWIPESHRARSNSLLMMAQPVAMALGAGASGLILDHLDGAFGVQGWRWMFLLEGVPAVIMGIVAYYYLDSNPEGSKGLTAAEVSGLNAILENDRKSKHQLSSSTSQSVFRQVMDRRVILLALAYFCLVNTLNANGTWIPTIVREVLTTYSFSYVGVVAAIPPICAFCLMPFWAASSDRRGERTWHLVGAMAVACVGWLLVILVKMPEIRLFGLVCTTTGAFCAMSIFWTLPQALLSEAARPAGIGLISTVGLLGSAVSPAVIGFLRDLTGAFSAGLYYVAILLVVSSLLVLTVVYSRRPVESAH